MKITHILGLLSSVLFFAGCATERTARYGSDSLYGEPVFSSNPAGPYDNSAIPPEQPRSTIYQGGAASTQLMTDSDRALTYQARQRCDRLTPGSTVTIYSRNGTITLTGTVPNDGDRLAVVSAVRSTPGVVAVNDQLQIVGAPTGRYDQERVYAANPTDFFSLHVRGLTDTDRTLGQRILEGLRTDSVLPTLMPIVNIEVSDSRVTVRGSVQSHEQKRTILEAVRRAAGVNNVYDELQVSPLPR